MVRAVLAVLFVAGFLAVVVAFIFAFIRKDGRPYSMRMAIFAVVLTFVFATFGLIAVGRVFYFHRVTDASTPTTVRVVFASQTYDLQSGLFGVAGSVQGLAPGQQLWVVFRDSHYDRLFPAQTPCDLLPDNRFNCSGIPTGAPSPSRPNVKGFLIAATPNAAAAISRLGTSGLSPRQGSTYQLPKGLTLISKITIGNE
jgi:hypothetical protein